eukprot:SAG31_NODE_8218_length_1494_cov_1.539068_2_plen_74_part_00
MTDPPSLVRAKTAKQESTHELETICVWFALQTRIRCLDGQRVTCVLLAERQTRQAQAAMCVPMANREAMALAR